MSHCRFVVGVDFELMFFGCYLVVVVGGFACILATGIRLFGILKKMTIVHFKINCQKEQASLCTRTG